MLNGLTSQLTPTVTPMPRHSSATRCNAPEIDLEQHRHDHQPDQHRNRNVDFGGGHAASAWNGGNGGGSTMRGNDGATHKVR
jgi:hypothetical protein